MAKAPAGSKAGKSAPKAVAKSAKGPGDAKDAGPPSKSSTRRPSVKPPALDLGVLRERIDSVDRAIQDLIAERARYAGQVGKAKGKLTAAGD